MPLEEPSAEACGQVGINRRAHQDEPNGVTAYRTNKQGYWVRRLYNQAIEDRKAAQALFYLSSGIAPLLPASDSSHMSTSLDLRMRFYYRLDLSNVEFNRSLPLRVACTWCMIVMDSNY